MKCNVGGTERNARLAAGSALIGAGVVVPMPAIARAAAFAVGAFGLFTGRARY